MTPKTTPLLKQDVIILEFIAKFGYPNDNQIQYLCNIKLSYYPKFIKRLVDRGYINRTKILVNKSSYLTLTKMGARFVGLKNAPTQPILNTLRHDTLLIDLYFKLQEKYPDGHFMVDKELHRLHKLETNHANFPKQIPDLLIDESIAIELELSLKNTTQLTQVITSYIVDNDFVEVHYFVDNIKHYNKIKSLTLEYPKFKFFMLNLDAKDNIISIEEIIQ